MKMPDAYACCASDGPVTAYKFHRTWCARTATRCARTTIWCLMESSGLGRWRAAIIVAVCVSNLALDTALVVRCEPLSTPFLGASRQAACLLRPLTSHPAGTWKKVRMPPPLLAGFAPDIQCDVATCWFGSRHDLCRQRIWGRTGCGHVDFAHGPEKVRPALWWSLPLLGRALCPTVRAARFCIPSVACVGPDSLLCLVEDLQRSMASSCHHTPVLNRSLPCTTKRRGVERRARCSSFVVLWL